MTQEGVEPILHAPYNAGWPREFAAEAGRLRAALSHYALEAIEHVGSTAVAGMTAKPIIDVMAGVADTRRLPSSGHDFWKNLGYACGHGDEEPGDWLYFIKRNADGERKFHLHVVRYGDDFWTRILLFRDALRADPAKAEQYLQLKIQLAQTFGGDRLRYRDGKAAFVARVVSEERNRRNSSRD